MTKRPGRPRRDGSSPHRQTPRADGAKVKIGGEGHFAMSNFHHLDEVLKAHLISSSSLLGHGERRDWSSWWSLSLRGKFWPRKRSCLLNSREIIGRTAEPGFGFLHPSRRSPKPPPAQVSELQLPKLNFVIRMLGSQSCRQMATAATVLSC